LATFGLIGALALSGCNSSAPEKQKVASNNPPIYTIAFEGSLSGDNEQLAVSQLNGARLAVDEANQKADLKFTLKLRKADDVGDSAKAPAAAARVLDDSSVIGVIGPNISGAAKAVGETYTEAGMAVISPSATNPALTTLGFTTFHRIVPSDEVEGAQVAGWLAKKATKVFVVDDLSDYGRGIADVVRADLAKAKIAVISQGVDAKTGDYGTIAAAVKQSGADALVYGGYAPQGARFATALKAAGYAGISIGGNGMKSTAFADGAKTAGNNWYFSCGCIDATVAPSAAAFADAYEARFKTDPPAYSAEAYDATNAMIDALQTADAAGTVSRATVLAAVNKLDYNGITTTISFEPDGEQVATNHTVNLFKQVDGKIELVGNITQQN
jgi:branched-chain amino acid transport system substrate-binding protein